MANKITLMQCMLKKSFSIRCTHCMDIKAMICDFLLHIYMCVCKHYVHSAFIFVDSNVCFLCVIGINVGGAPVACPKLHNELICSTNFGLWLDQFATLVSIFTHRYVVCICDMCYVTPYYLCHWLICN